MPILGLMSTPGCATVAPTCASSVISERFTAGGRRGGVPADDRATSAIPELCSEHFARDRRCVPSRGPGRGAVFVSTPNVLTLAPAVRCARTIHGMYEYRAEEFPGAVPSAFRDRGDVRAVPRAQAARARARAAAGLGRGAPAPGPDAALLRLVHPRDRRLRFPHSARPEHRARRRARIFLSRCAGRERGPRSRRAGDRPAHAHALRRGLRHVAVRRGVAVGGDAGSYLPLLDLLDLGRPWPLSLTPVLCDQLEAAGAGALRAVCRGVRCRTRSGCGRTAGGRTCRSCARGGARMGRLRRRGGGPGASRRGPARLVSRHAQWTSAATHAVLPLLATDAGVRLQVDGGVAAHRRRSAMAGAAASGCRSAPTPRGSTEP